MHCIDRCIMYPDSETNTEAAVMLTTLHVQLLGDFRLVYGDELVRGVNTARLQSLLAYLVLHRDAPQARQHLAFLFWPDSTEAQSRNNLRQALHQLRHALPDADRFLSADTTTLYWQSDAAFSLDVADFARALATADAAERVANPAAMRAALEQAVSLYRGDLLPSCYDEWIAPERDRLYEQQLKALERLVRILEDQREYATAIPYAQRLLRHDPLDEDSYLHLMRLHSLNNDRAGALRVYHACASALQRELGVEPSPATRDAYERLLRMDAAPTAHRPALAAASPLIGRQSAWEQLQTAWQRAACGQAHFALITGEAGMGKSRLAEELFAWVREQGFATAETRAYAAEGRLAYGPVADWLRSEPLRAAPARLDTVWLTEVARLLPELPAEHPDLPHPEPLTEHWQRQRLFEALARAVLQASQPLLLLIDDLQWCDQETLEWLHYLLRFDPTARLLVVGTARAEELGTQHPLTTLLHDLRSAGDVTEIALIPLDAAETAKLAAHVATRELDAEQAIRLYQETEGNPLFVVETVRAGVDRRLEIGDWRLESQSQSPSSNLQSLPPRVHAVIVTRLAQLSAPARELAGLAATVGRAFTFDVLGQASDGGEDSLVRGLDELWQRRIVREHGAHAYDFTHDKLREVAYAEVSPIRRRLLHRRVAQAMEIIYASDLDPVSAQVAAHYEQAGLLEQAIHYYQRAAAVAQRVYANEEAISLLNKGLALLRRLPQNLERDARELALQTALGVSLVATRGYAALDAIDVYSRARALCQRLSRPPSPPVLRALAIAHIVRAEFQQARDLGDQLLALAEHDQDPVLLVEAHYVLGVTLFWQGAFAPSRGHLEQAIARYDPQQSRMHIALYSQDPKVVCLCRLALDLWYLGYPDQAAQTSQAALALARELSHPFSLSYAGYLATLLHSHRRAVQETQAQAEAVIALCRAHRLSFWLPPAMVLHGWALAEQGAIEAGIAQIREGMAAFHAMGAEYMRPYLLTLLAEQYAKVGDVEQGLTLLAEALAMVDKSGERWYEAEIYRTRGELLLMHGEDADAEAAFVRARAVARSQEAKSPELRAVMSVARLWQRQARHAEARQMLAEIYSWFTEGFDTPDLQDARALLEHL
jgi:DNA-binding SARP family transcriptional activator/predicted ATPase